MQSGKHENFNKQSPASRLRAHNRLESGPEPYSGSRRSNIRREAADHSIRGTLSPHELQQDVGVSQRTDYIDRRDYGWHLGGGRTDRVRQRSRSASPVQPFGNMRKGRILMTGLGFCVGIIHRRHRFVWSYHADKNWLSLEHIMQLMI